MMFKHPAVPGGLAFLLGSFITLNSTASEPVYRWTDEHGQAVYSQFAAPPGQPAERVAPPPPPAESPETAQQRLQEQLQQLEDQREDRALAAQKDAESKAAQAERRERCEAARHNLQGLSGRPRQLFVSSDGTVSRMSEEQRATRRAELEKILAEECEPD